MTRTPWWERKGVRDWALMIALTVLFGIALLLRLGVL